MTKPKPGAKQGRPLGIHTPIRKVAPFPPSTPPPGVEGTGATKDVVGGGSTSFAIYEEPPAPAGPPRPPGTMVPTPGGLIGGDSIFLMAANMINNTVLAKKTIKIGTDPNIHLQLGCNLQAAMGGVQINPMYALIINCIFVFVFPILLAYYREIWDYISSLWNKDKGKNKLKEALAT